MTRITSLSASWTEANKRQNDLLAQMEPAKDIMVRNPYNHKTEDSAQVLQKLGTSKREIESVITQLVNQYRNDPSDEDKAIILNNLAYAYASLNLYSEAEEILEEAKNLPSKKSQEIINRNLNVIRMYA